MSTLRDKISGAILGLFVGDALGLGPCGYDDLDEMRRDHGDWINNYAAPKKGRRHDRLQAGDNSQTGQVCGLLLESLAGMQLYEEEDFTRRLDELLDTLDGGADSGRYTDQAMREVWQARRAGIPWSRAGSFADTAEAAIRAPILAARHAHDFPRAFANLRGNVLLTHRDPLVAGQSLAFGLVVHALINGVSLADSSEHIRQQTQRHGLSLAMPLPEEITRNREAVQHQAGCVDAALLPAFTAKAAADPAFAIDEAWRVCRLFGLARSLSFMLPAAYYFVARFPNDFETAVLSAINGGGENMARASLTGALAGASVGLDGIPKRFIDGLRDRERLLELTRTVAAQAVA